MSELTEFEAQIVMRQPFAVPYDRTPPMVVIKWSVFAECHQHAHLAVCSFVAENRKSGHGYNDWGVKSIRVAPVPVHLKENHTVKMSDAWKVDGLLKELRERKAVLEDAKGEALNVSIRGRHCDNLRETVRAAVVAALEKEVQETVDKLKAIGIDIEMDDGAENVTAPAGKSFTIDLPLQAKVVHFG